MHFALMGSTSDKLKLVFWLYLLSLRTDPVVGCQQINALYLIFFHVAKCSSNSYCMQLILLSLCRALWRILRAKMENLAG